MLEIQNVSKTFNAGTVNQKIALNGLNLKLNEGDFVTVIGGNGAGKSTMLNAVAGVWPVDEGKILIDGVDVTRLSEHQRAAYIGRVFQDPMTGTAATMQIEENLALAARRGKRRTLRIGITKAEREQYRELLKTLDLGLEDRLTARVGLLSGGQRQALTLLMATMNKPKLLLLDEHTAALDPKTALKVLTLSARIVEENHLTTMMITHNMKDAIKYGNRLIMMHEGHIIYDVAGEEKQKLHVSDLLAKFQIASGGEFANDRMILSTSARTEGRSIRLRLERPFLSRDCNAKNRLPANGREPVAVCGLPLDIVVHVHQVADGAHIIGDVGIAVDGVLDGAAGHCKVDHIHGLVVVQHGVD